MGPAGKGFEYLAAISADALLCRENRILPETHQEMLTQEKTANEIHDFGVNLIASHWILTQPSGSRDQRLQKKA